MSGELKSVVKIFLMQFLGKKAIAKFAKHVASNIPVRSRFHLLSVSIAIFPLFYSSRTCHSVAMPCWYFSSVKKVASIIFYQPLSTTTCTSTIKHKFGLIPTMPITVLVYKTLMTVLSSAVSIVIGMKRRDCTQGFITSQRW